MLVKFETKSARVKGLSFHPRRPWILARSEELLSLIFNNLSVHSRSTSSRLSFHNQQLFVSGGDDYKVKLWNYKLRRCLYTFLGHLDYLRTTYFHHKQPWILSASDDQTIRIWNWQRLRKKQTERSKSPIEGRQNNTRSPDLFAPPDAVVRHLMEGHSSGVNWLDRERPAFAVHGNLIYYIKERLLRRLDLTTSKDQAVLQLKGGPRLNVRSLSYNPAENTVLLTTRPPNSDNGSYELYVIPGDTNSSQPETAECKKGQE
ncbi:Coatomer subunit alpha [Orchesella cincta]|uniref:Coatomer subunit alpha n=1 Tax=Orchesella cincta TaxID=48709 RepID=A0A1D2M8Q0_ORCCI|nr:Coatomer subunit alpha [Orchesella cincta]